jgi:two-component system NarL family sensor kinase
MPDDTRPSIAAQIHQRNRELSILNSIAQALNRSVDLEQALQSTLAQVAELLGLHTGWIWLLKQETGEPYLAAAQNLPPGLVHNPALMEGSCYCLDTYQTGDLDGAANINVITCSRLQKLVGGTEGLRYHASIPLYVHGEGSERLRLGVLNLASTDWRELSTEDLRLLYTIGDLLSIAVERARLFAESAEYGAAEERNRLAREIHDTLAQGLAGLVMQLETADVLAENQTEPQAVREAIGRALSLARASLEEARRSVLDLRAAPLEGRTLVQALEALAAEVTSDEIEVRFESSGGNIPLPIRVEVGLFRIAQESLANAARYSGSRTATLRLVILPDMVMLVVEDHGRGFDLSLVPLDRFGLIGMNERAKLLGGRLQVHSQPGRGTKVEVKIPLQ